MCRVGHFDGQSSAHIGFQLEHDPDLPVTNSWSRLQDCIFKDLVQGFWQTDDIPGTGTDSEFSILRCEFYRCSEFGVRVVAGEAYNYWVRQCYFEDCDVGIGNGPSGAFNAYDNVFVRSTSYDIYATAMRFCGIRRNQSFDSKRFAYIKGSGVVMESNDVSNPTETDAVQIEGREKIAILSNRFRSSEEATTGPVINELTNRFEGDAALAPLFVMLNQFTVTDPVHFTPDSPVNNDVQGNFFVPSLSIDQQALPPHPPQVIRPIFYFDVLAQPPQETIDEAASFAVENPGSAPCSICRFMRTQQDSS